MISLGQKITIHTAESAFKIALAYIQPQKIVGLSICLRIVMYIHNQLHQFQELSYEVHIHLNYTSIWIYLLNSTIELLGLPSPNTFPGGDAAGRPRPLLPDASVGAHRRDVRQPHGRHGFGGVSVAMKRAGHRKFGV